MKILLMILLLTSCIKKNIIFTATLRKEGTESMGWAEVELFDKKVTWKVELIDVPNITMAHIHCHAGGHIAATLSPNGDWIHYRSSIPTFVGEFTEPDSKNKCGYKNLDELIDAMEHGKTYINVHTKEYPAGMVQGDVNVSPKPKGLFDKWDFRN